MRWIFFVASLAVSACGQNVPSELAPDAIYHSGHVLTVDEPFSVAEAFAIKSDRFIAVGTNDEVQALVGGNTQQVDLQGHTVVPGLMDNHHHLIWNARLMNRGIDMVGVPSLAELLGRLRQAAAGAAPGEIIVASGGWDPRGFPEQRGPTRQELDEAVPNNLLMLFTRGRNNAHLNSAALARLGIDRTTLDWGSFPILRDEETGEPTGYLSGGEQVVAADFQLLPQPPVDEQIAWIEKEQLQELAKGLTVTRELVLPVEYMRIYAEMNRQQRLKMRVSMGLMFGVQHVDGWSPLQIDRMLADLPPFPGLGDDMLQFDGTVAEFEVTTQRVSTWNRTPYPPDSNNIGLRIARWPHSPLLQVVRDDEGQFYGIHRLPTEMFHEVVKKINRYGYRPAFHISGNAALDWHLGAYEAADRDMPIASKRWVAEHATSRGADAEQIERLANLDLILSAQRRPNPMRSVLDQGLTVTLGSDYPAFESNPFGIMSYYVTRRDAQGQIVEPLSEAITREEVLRMYTINNAYLMFWEDRLGSIEPGKLADFVILSADLMSVPDEQIKDLHPLATYVGGRQVYAREGGGF